MIIITKSENVNSTGKEPQKSSEVCRDLGSGAPDACAGQSWRTRNRVLQVPRLGSCSVSLI